MDNSRENPHSFTAFSSAAQNAAQQGEAAAQINRGPRGPNAAPSEITTLERRVLAHERILLALIVRLAEADADILVQLKASFGSGHNLGEYEQDYVSTDHYGDYFIRSVERAIATRDRQADD